MTRSVLLLSTATRWLGSARMPRVLARAGFEVSLIAPTGSLAAKSRYFSAVQLLPDNSIPMQWLVALIAMVERTSPRLVVPCDEMALRLLFALVLETPEGLAPAVRSKLSALVVESLGDPAHYMTSVDKTLLSPAAAALGVRVPRFIVTADIDAARAFAAELGYPVVLKRRFGFAGGGVAIVSSPADLAREARALLVPDQLDVGEYRTPQLLVQEFLAGRHVSQTVVARDGVPIASFARERHVAITAVKGQTSVVRFIESDETRIFAETLCRALGISGFISVQFIIDARTGLSHMLEINRRIVTHMHLGERVGVDLAAHLAARLGIAAPPPAAPATHADVQLVADFPREWLRDPDSRYLQDHPVDAPWDDPALFEAMLAMRHEV